MSDVVLVDARGKPSLRGRHHGEDRREIIHEHLARWEDQLNGNVHLSTEDYLDKLIDGTPFLRTISDCLPTLLEEVVGISEGANADFRRVLARQLSDEEPWFRRDLLGSETSCGACSAIGFNSGGETVIAQNMDSPGWWLGHQQVLLTGDHDTSAYMFTLAGKISLCGTNNHGLGICCNTLSELQYSLEGLPEDFVVRGFLMCRSFEEGWRFLRSVNHASGQNYMIGGPSGEIANLECSAREVCENNSRAGPYLFHTNTAWTNPDRLPPRETSRQEFTGTSQDRAAAIGRMLENVQEPSVDQIKSTLASKDGPVCRTLEESEGRSVTLGTIVMHLGKRTIEVTNGPPDRNPFTTFHF